MIEMHLVVGFVSILISILLANKKENYLVLVCGVVAPCYQHHGKGDTTPRDKSLSPETTVLCM